MAGKKKTRQRIEPGFDPAASSRAKSVASGSGPSAKRRGKKQPARKRGGMFGFVRLLTYWSFVVGIWGAIGVSILVAYYAVKLPQSANWTVPDRPPNARIVSVDGELLANRGVTGGEALRLEEMSPYIPKAVIAIEDRRFHHHFGVDPIGIARAMVSNLLAGRLVQGGSTLTQQLAKNLFLEPRRDLERKVQEAILAIWLEREFTKDEIIELYLNRVYFGSGAYGVDAAARRYFSKSARDVNLAEAALLAGLLKAPSKLTPARNPKGADDRAQTVLAAMRRADFVTDREVATALLMEADQAKKFWNGSEHYVADIVMKRLKDLVGDIDQDVIIDTTIDLDLQKKAGDLIYRSIATEGDKYKVEQGALVSLDGTGAVRALVGGVEYADSQFNRAIDAKRQPGSAFKPIVYLSAIEHGRTPETVRVDRPVKIGNWQPQNYNKKYMGPVTLSEALSGSLNTIAAQLVAEVGPRSVSETAARLGIESRISRNASIALGTSEVNLMELTGAYAPFSNGGYQAEPFFIKQVRSLDGEVLYQRQPASAAKVVEAPALGMMNQMLQRVIEEGTGKAARIDDWQIAGKTGTSQNFRDALFVGYTANLVTGVWYGNDDNSSTAKLTGGSMPARTFADFMQFAHNGVPVAELPGAYAPLAIAIIPTPRPQVGLFGALSSGNSNSGNSNTLTSARDGGAGQAVQRKALSDLDSTSGIRPSASVGEAPVRKKPKGILDLLLGG